VTLSIAVTSTLPGRAEQILGGRFDVRIHDGPQLVDEIALIRFIGAADAAVTLLANPVTERVLISCPALRVVGNVAVGYDNIDLEAAAARGIWDRPPSKPARRWRSWRQRM
jgi:glyoxylate reductase